MRVAILIYERGLQVHHYNLAKGFCDKGDDVHLFIHDADEFVFKLKNFKGIKIHLHQFYNTLSYNYRIKTKILHLFKIYPKSVISADSIVYYRTLRKSRKKIAQIGDFDIAIGVEKLGLVWAGKVFEDSHAKLLYYSLEIYEDDHYAFKNDSSFHLVRGQEKLFHQKCDATIVQDSARCKYLYEFNNIYDQKAIFLPVSVSKDIPILKEHYLRTRLNLKDAKIILFFGRIDDNRRCLDIAKGFAGIKESSFFLVMNGDGDSEYINSLKNFSPNIVHREKSPDLYIDSIINDSHIGLVTYSYKSVNEELTVFASEKLALYLKHKKPVISFANPQYEKFFKEFRCGIAIKNTDYLWEAINEIDNNYQYFSSEAGRAYEEYFCFENRFNILYRDIEELTTKESD